MSVKLDQYQLDAVEKMKNGCILCGGVGSGKSRTALTYYLLRECGGEIKINGKGQYQKMIRPRDLYIITTAKKRDTLEWDKECAAFVLTNDREISHSGVSVKVDSWNNIQKYKNTIGAFFIFDEQRVIGSGTWVRAFLNISRKNHWVLLSATPGDAWTDYIPVFVANGFYRNKTEFQTRHCVYARYTKFPKIEKYLDEQELESYRDQILVKMEDQRVNKRVENELICSYDFAEYRKAIRTRWDPYKNEPIVDGGGLIYVLRRIVNSDEDRLFKLKIILQEKKKAIIFYNFNYELDLLRGLLRDINIKFGEWNGKKHEEIPESDEWAYLVQYTAGCEGWNCITCDTIIFYSQNYSYKVLEQAMGRIDRMNTPFEKLYYYYLRSNASIDLAILQKLRDKKIFSERAFLKKGWV